MTIRKTKAFRKVLRAVIAHRLLPALLFLILLIPISLAYRNNSFSLHFVDEEENLIIAKYLLEGDKLYADVFSNHQPVSYLISAAIQSLTHPNSIYLLIERHREFVIAWSALWSLILAFRFGWRLLPVAAVFELTKIFLLGNLFLAETLFVYPFVYLLSFALTFRKAFYLEYIFLGVLFGFEIFSLSPLWPALLALFAFISYSNKRVLLQTAGLMSLGLVGVMGILTAFVSWPDYFYQTIYINLKYFVPIASTDPQFLTLGKAFLTPLLVFFPSPADSSIGWIIRAIVLLLLLNLFILREKRFLVACIIVILGLTNIRYVQPGLDYYRGFHLLPWFAAILTTVSFTGFMVIEGKILGVKHFLAVLSFGVVILLVTLTPSFHTLFLKRDIRDDFFINYSWQFYMGEAVRIMKGTGDTLFVAPDEWLVYWQANIQHPIPLLGFYAWMFNTPYLNSQVHNMFQLSPPTFLYINYGDIPLRQYFSKYQEMKKDGKGTMLFVLPSRLNNLTEDQKKKLIFLGFDREQFK